MIIVCSVEEQINMARNQLIEMKHALSVLPAKRINILIQLTIIVMLALNITSITHQNGIVVLKPLRRINIIMPLQIALLIVLKQIKFFHTKNINALNASIKMNIIPTIIILV